MAPHPGVGINCVTLINHIQNQVFNGVGGRKDLAHELKGKWSQQQIQLVEAGATQDHIWEQFKACQHEKEMHLLDQQGLITKKASESARSVIPPEQASVNQEMAHRIIGLTNQSDALTEQQQDFNSAMSVIGCDQRAFNVSGVLAFVQTEATNGSASANWF